MHTALLYLTGFLLLAALILVFRRSLVAFVAAMALLWWAGGQTTEPEDLAAFHGAQAMVAKTVYGYTHTVGYLVGVVEHSAEAAGFAIEHPPT